MAFKATLLFAEVEAALIDANASQALLFAAVGEALTQALNGPPPARLEARVYALAVILAVELVLMGCSIGLRVRMGRGWCWLFERRTTRFGTYLVPNASFAWQIPVFLFLAALQVNTWFLWAFMTNNPPAGFYVQETACWLGFAVATLIATWSLACARALELAAAGVDTQDCNGVRWYNSPGCLNWLFSSLVAFFTVHTLIWGGLANSAYAHSANLLEGSVAAELAADAVAAGGMTADEFGAARERAIGVVQDGLDAYRDLVWHVKAGFLACAGHDLLTWILSLLICIPYLARLRTRLYHPARALSPSLPPSTQADLRLAFFAACTTAAVLSLACLAYALLVLVRVTTYGGWDAFRTQALRAAVAGVWVLVGLGLVACPVAVGHSVLLWRAERGGGAGRMGRVVELWSPAEVGSRLGSGSGGRRKEGQREGLSRGRFVVVIKRAAGSGEVGEEIDLDAVELARKAGEEEADGSGE